MAKIKTLKDMGEVFYPQTHIEAVVDDNGNTVTGLIDEISRKITPLETEIGELGNKIDKESERAAAKETELAGKIQRVENIAGSKQDPLVSGTNIKTINGQPVLGSGNILINSSSFDNPLRALFVAAGAEYNDSGTDVTKTAPWGEDVIHKAGHYYLNGLGDITDEEMLKIYNYRDVVYRLNMPRLAQSVMVRTFYPVNAPTSNMTQYMSNNKLNAYSLFYGASKLEVFLATPKEFGSTGFSLIPAKGSLSSIFGQCSSLKYLGGINCESVDAFTEAFDGCNSLIEVRLFKIKTNVSFKDSLNISKNSILYIIQNAIPTSAITITLHAAAYAKLVDDVDIVKVLKLKNGYIDENGNPVAGTLPIGASINLGSA